jgi:hypothetical protein
MCEKEGHSIHICFKIFSQMRNQDGDDRQYRKGNFKRNYFKGKKNMKAMQANIWDHDSDESEGEDLEVEDSSDK